MNIKTITPDNMTTDNYASVCVYADKKLSDAKAIKAAREAVQAHGFVVAPLAVMDRTSNRSGMVSVFIRYTR